MVHCGAIASPCPRICRLPVSRPMPAAGNQVLRPKPLMLAAVFAGIAGLAAFAIHFVINREAAPAVSPPAAERAAHPPRPALTAAEEQYIRELLADPWGRCQRSALRMSLGQIFYLTKDLGRAELGTRVKDALATYRAAGTRLSGPWSRRHRCGCDHEEYLSAVRLFQESAAEVLKMFADGRDDHMQVAYPKSQQGSDKIRRRRREVLAARVPGRTESGLLSAYRPAPGRIVTGTGQQDLRRNAVRVDNVPRRGRL